MVHENWRTEQRMSAVAARGATNVKSCQGEKKVGQRRNQKKAASSVGTRKKDSSGTSRPKFGTGLHW